ncbi:NTP transferase domain-containing protein [Cellulomonas sp. ATA003]|uniref:nucleotidyltransferase family protein n=1 Tax=Cellulomonas sp. ATA003 TaxID=3073064 RepID=UPI002872DD59|nr:NTP transferase domain-containing protein [Cellulomonas sp. ATA003]WNB87441.1 NTP transferase domain-containing protein [Cellulomonas sp. ATA003]
MGQLCGVVLAAGAGTRYGGPKALAAGPDGPWLPAAVRLLRDGGCERVVVVLGAGAGAARALLADDPAVTAVVAEHWERGLGESLRAGLAHASGDAAVVTLVDLPGTPATVVRRVLAPGADPGTLRRAVFDARPGHPVVLGRDHWGPLADHLAADPGDHGARTYLRAHGVERVECGDLHHGQDVDTPRQ